MVLTRDFLYSMMTFLSDAPLVSWIEHLMLNKSLHIVDAIRVLDNILQRMQTHQSKKRSMLRRLHCWNKAKVPTRAGATAFPV
jgi:pyruvate kinase